MVDPREFRSVLGCFATGVTVVTMMDRDRPRGITVNAFTSLSLDPPLLGIAIDLRSRSHGTLARCDRFGVSILAAHQAPIADHFAGRTRITDLELLPWQGVHIVPGAVAHLSCRIVQTVPVGDHTLFVGRVEDHTRTGGHALLFFRSRYGAAETTQLA